MERVVVLLVLSALLMLPSGAYAQENGGAEDQQAQAQQELQTQFLMMNKHVCPAENMQQLMQLVESQLAPALQQMEEAGEISDWGVLTHAWGDEYNFNFYIITDSHQGFVDSWPSLLQRSNEIDPEWYDKFAPLCTMHKDNMYTLHDYEGSPTAGSTNERSTDDGATDDQSSEDQQGGSQR